MPNKPARACGYPGCDQLVRGARYCAVHEQQVTARYETARGTASQRGYGSDWRVLRAMQLSRFPLCADPFGLHKAAGRIEPATDVDHVIPRSRGGTDRFDNLQSLCHSCHSRKTVMEDGGYGGHKPGPDSHGTARVAPCEKKSQCGESG